MPFIKTKSRIWLFPLIVMGLVLILPDSCKKEEENTCPIPTLISPKENAILDNGCASPNTNLMNWSFEWTSCPNTVKYNLYVKHPTAQYPAIDIETTESKYEYSEIGYTGSTNWDWKVRAFTGGSWGEWSKQGTFGVEPFGTDCPFNYPEDPDTIIVFNPDLTYGTVSDIDGNTYNTIQISTQVWMAENLKTTKYNDGTAIPLVADEIAWAALSSPGYCWYNNDEAIYKATFGALYNWYVVDSASNGGKNVCPSGWHVPSNAEWTTLTTYLGGEDVAGGKLKETGFSHWSMPNEGATNESGFTALPSGYRNDKTGFHWGIWYDNGIAGIWWSSTNSDKPTVYSRSVHYDYSSILITYDVGIHFGNSVRCLKD
jgi:uncharacterized protein (TIGR02145 family)